MKRRRALIILVAATVCPACVGGGSFPNLTGRTLTQVRSEHPRLLDPGKVSDVLRDGRRNYFIIGTTELEEAEQPRDVTLALEAQLDARQVLFAKLVRPESLRGQELELKQFTCPYEWHEAERYHVGCFVPIEAVRIVRSAPTALNTDVVTAGNGDHSVEPRTALSGPPISEDNSFVHSLEQARRLRGEERCHEAIAAYDRLLDTFPTQSLKNDVLGERLLTLRDCP